MLRVLVVHEHRVHGPEPEEGPEFVRSSMMSSNDEHQFWPTLRSMPSSSPPPRPASVPTFTLPELLSGASEVSSSEESLEDEESEELELDSSDDS